MESQTKSLNSSIILKFYFDLCIKLLKKSLFFVNQVLNSNYHKAPENSFIAFYVYLLIDGLMRDEIDL